MGDLNHGAHHIDPYWNPFNKVDDVKSQVTAEFDEYSRYVSIAEAKRVRIQIKKSLKRSAEIYNPYSKGFAEHHGRVASELPPQPFRLADKYWERPPLHERLARERITWRDVDIIQHFIADNGYILPRRTTMLSRSKQKDLVNAVKRAQSMSLIPIGWRPNDYQAMPLTDPLQWMADRLIDRVIEHRDRRSEAMIRVMMERHQELNFGRFLKHVARRAEREPDGAHFEGFVEKFTYANGAQVPTDTPAVAAATAAHLAAKGTPILQDVAVAPVAHVGYAGYGGWPYAHYIGKREADSDADILIPGRAPITSVGAFTTYANGAVVPTDTPAVAAATSAHLAARGTPAHHTGYVAHIGYAGYPYAGHFIGKREAESEADPAIYIAGRAPVISVGGLTTYANGAQVPTDTPAVAAATAAHL